MFHLVNQYGNVHKKVESERKRDELIAAGYRLVEEPVEEEGGVEDVAPYDGPEQTDEPQQVDDPLQMYTTEDDTQATAAIKVTTPPQQVDDSLQMYTTEDDTQATAAIKVTTPPQQVEVNPKKGKAKKNAAEE